MGAWSPTTSTRFSGRVDDYVRARPGYPDGVIELLAAEMGLTPTAVIADVGSGTGISALPFLQNGNRVICVEPNAEMRTTAESLLHHYPGFRSVAGSAEQSGLPSASVDVIVVAQAFHWFDVERARVEFRRILRDNGWVVLLWNTRRTQGTDFLVAYEALLQQFGTDYVQVQQRTNRLTSGAASGDGGLDRFFAGGYTRRVLENAQDLDFEALKSRLRSASYVPTEASPDYAPMIATLREVFERTARDGRVRIEYDLEIFLGQLT